MWVLCVPLQGSSPSPSLCLSLSPTLTTFTTGRLRMRRSRTSQEKLTNASTVWAQEWAAQTLLGRPTMAAPQRSLGSDVSRASWPPESPGSLCVSLPRPPLALCLFRNQNVSFVTNRPSLIGGYFNKLILLLYFLSCVFSIDCRKVLSYEGVVQVLATHLWSPRPSVSASSGSKEIQNQRPPQTC